MVQVHIVSGFLGAGKTTLIRKLIKNIQGKKVIIENEFGEVGIDGETIKRENYDVVEMASGCICCSMKGDFKDTLLTVIRDYRPEHIIIEPTGVGMLSQILDMFYDHEIKEKCILMIPITVVDSIDYLEQSENFGSFFSDQIANAGIVILSKTKFMKKNDLDIITESIKKLNPRAEILSENWEDLTEIEYCTMSDSRYDLSKREIIFSENIRNLSKNIQSLSIKIPKHFCKKDLEASLERLPDEKNGKIIRAKGYVDGKDGALEFSYVNGRYTVEFCGSQVSSRICIIGCSLKKNALLDLFSV